MATAAQRRALRKAQRVRRAIAYLRRLGYTKSKAKAMARAKFRSGSPVPRKRMGSRKRRALGCGRSLRPAGRRPKAPKGLRRGKIFKRKGRYWRVVGKGSRRRAVPCSAPGRRSKRARRVLGRKRRRVIGRTRRRVARRRRSGRRRAWRMTAARRAAYKRMRKGGKGRRKTRRRVARRRRRGGMIPTFLVGVRPRRKRRTKRYARGPYIRV